MVVRRLLGAGGISIDNATHTLLMRKADGNHALYTFGNYSASAGAPAAKLIYDCLLYTSDAADE